MAELTPTTAAEAEALWRERLQKRMWVAAKYKGAFHPIEISGVAGDEILLCFEQKHEWRKKTDPTIQPLERSFAEAEETVQGGGKDVGKSPEKKTARPSGTKSTKLEYGWRDTKHSQSPPKPPPKSNLLFQSQNQPRSSRKPIPAKIPKPSQTPPLTSSRRKHLNPVTHARSTPGSPSNVAERRAGRKWQEKSEIPRDFLENSENLTRKISGEKEGQRRASPVGKTSGEDEKVSEVEPSTYRRLIRACFGGEIKGLSRQSETEINLAADHVARLFERCLQLMEEAEKIEKSEGKANERVDDFSRRVGRMGSEIDRLVQGDEKERSKEVQAGWQIFGGIIKKTITPALTFAAERNDWARRQIQAKREDEAIKRLEEEYVLVSVPQDGNSFYTAISVCYRFQTALKEAPYPTVYSEILKNFSKLPPAKTLQGHGLEMRKKAISSLTDYPTLYSRDIVSTIRESLTRKNPTENDKRLINSFEVLYGTADPEEICHYRASDRALEVFVGLHSMPGVGADVPIIKALAGKLTAKIQKVKSPPMSSMYNDTYYATSGDSPLCLAKNEAMSQFTALLPRKPPRFLAYRFK
ncbi:hypothetical protein AAMO2058_001476600 [Amorphochlora amoebiformis]